ncbi:hypothetical protein RJ640_002892, partial [Escallonia rubra]
MPFGNDSYKSAKILGYLNSQQALADFAVLIRSLKQNLSSKASPVVVFGGSYEGMAVTEQLYSQNSLAISRHLEEGKKHLETAILKQKTIAYLEVVRDTDHDYKLMTFQSEDKNTHLHFEETKGSAAEDRTRRRATLHNGCVVPYNPYFLAKFNCHINVEICSSIKAVKYLYKCIYKGHDRVLVVTQETNISIDEISQFQSARWVSPPESAWRIFGFPLNDISPSVLAIYLHLPILQSVVLHAADNLAHLASDQRTSRTMLTEFFKINQLHKDGPRYLYSEFPEHYVWNYGSRTWEPRHQHFSIGRIVCANPAECERYYLRLLLLHVRGPTSFNTLKTVDRVFYSSYRAVAQAYGLLEGDNTIEECLQKASTFQMPSALRRLFATLLVHCEVGNPRLLLEKFSTQLCEDFQCTYGSNEKLMHYKMITNIAQCIESMEKQQADFDLPLVSYEDIQLCKRVKDIEEELNIHIPPEDILAVLKLNTGQMAAYKIIMQHVRGQKAAAFFIDRPGGTCKTYLYNALLATVRSEGYIALATTSSGIAASNLPGGQTAHSRTSAPRSPSVANKDNTKDCATLNQQVSLKGVMREKVQVATKFGVRVEDRKPAVHGDPAYARACCEASLKWLEIDCIDLYYVHRIDTTVPIEVMVRLPKSRLAL